MCLESSQTQFLIVITMLVNAASHSSTAEESDKAENLLKYLHLVLNIDMQIIAVTSKVFQMHYILLIVVSFVIAETQLLICSLKT